jgi:hypothetical protein
MGEAIAAAIPGAQRVELTFAHIPFVEVPQRFVELAGGFLEAGHMDRR